MMAAYACQCCCCSDAANARRVTFNRCAKGPAEPKPRTSPGDGTAWSVTTDKLARGSDGELGFTCRHQMRRAGQQQGK